MTTKQKFDSSLLQFVPKGSFYNTQDEQLQKISEVWSAFLKQDRTIFTLSSLLPGTVYSKGRMAHMLLSTPQNKGSKDLQKYGLPEDFESEVILWSLRNERDMAKVIKSLIMLCGVKGKDDSEYLKRVNNSRTKKVILRYVFERENKSLEAMSLKFKSKIAQLVRHALGSQDLTKLLNGKAKAERKVTRYNSDALPIVFFLFGKEYKGAQTHFEKLALYQDMRVAAKAGKVDEFLKIANKKVIPFEVVLGFRNTYKLDIDKDKIYSVGKMSDKQKIQNVTASKRSGAKVDVDYKKQDIYDLWKLFYVNTLRDESEDIDKIADGIIEQSKKKLGIDLGKVVVIFDASKSMEGSDARPFHPLLTGLSLVSKLDNIEDVIYVGGQKVKTPSTKIGGIVVPSGSTSIWKALVDASEKKPDTILVVSDGYENSVKGVFNHVYDHLKKEGATFNMLHVNPVFAAETGGLRALAEDVKPMALDSYKFLKTNIVFEMITQDKDVVKKMLAGEFQKLIGAEGGK